ncbi:PREDICTED: serine protease 40-like [Chinchilla lanigera]|uniref:Serine protease 40-like n=1 Tax=Chinchilla lanigera TaxID=34839 RepID=A0A8C2UTT7_CHILA|nr:PREDICTED: serine protease 40-like [Chinchilla lanigera]
MGGAREQQSGLGWARLWALAALLLRLHFLALAAQDTQPLSEVCGRPAYRGKIFGGNKANPERWPWQASLLLHGRHICGASLIDRNWVISAAHCFQRSHSPSDYRVLLGYNKLSSPTNFSLQMTVYKLIVHEDYDKIHRMSRDIVLMQLHRPVEFNSHVLPVCLPDSSLNLDPFASCWITGWGMLTEDTFLSAPFQLQEGEMALISREHCAEYYELPPGVEDPNPYVVKEDMLCAAEFATERSVCRGDSGGPLVCPVQGIWYLIGVSSWSAPCLRPVGPSVFANVTYFANWIKEQKQASPPPEVAVAPPQEKPPALTGLNARDTVVKPQIFIVLLSSQIFLLQLILLRNL